MSTPDTTEAVTRAIRRARHAYGLYGQVSGISQKVAERAIEADRKALDDAGYAITQKEANDWRSIADELAQQVKEAAEAIVELDPRCLDTGWDGGLAIARYDEAVAKESKQS